MGPGIRVIFIGRGTLGVLGERGVSVGDFGDDRRDL